MGGRVRFIMLKVAWVGRGVDLLCWKRHGREGVDLLC